MGLNQEALVFVCVAYKMYIMPGIRYNILEISTIGFERREAGSRARGLGEGLHEHLVHRGYRREARSEPG